MEQQSDNMYDAQFQDAQVGSAATDLSDFSMLCHFEQDLECPVPLDPVLTVSDWNADQQEFSPQIPLSQHPAIGNYRDHSPPQTSHTLQLTTVNSPTFPMPQATNSPYAGYDHEINSSWLQPGISNYVPVAQAPPSYSYLQQQQQEASTDRRQPHPLDATPQYMYEHTQTSHSQSGLESQLGYPLRETNGNTRLANRVHDTKQLPTTPRDEIMQANVCSPASESNRSTPHSYHQRGHLNALSHSTNGFEPSNPWENLLVATNYTPPPPEQFGFPSTNYIPANMYAPCRSSPPLSALPSGRKRKYESSPEAESSVPQLRRVRKATPHISKKHAKFEDRPKRSLPNSIYGPFQHFYPSFAAAREAFLVRKWHPQKGPGFPTTDAEKEVYVKQIYDAMTDYRMFYDHLEGKSKNRMLTQTYPVQEIEARCWEVVDAAIDLHENGSTLCSWADPTVSSRKAKEDAHASSHNGKGKQPANTGKNHPDHELTFQQRINEVCKTVREFKSACCDILDGVKLRAVVYGPTATWKIKYSNLNSNDNRKPVYADGQEIKKRRVAREQAQAEADAACASLEGDPDECNGK